MAHRLCRSLLLRMEDCGFAMKAIADTSISLRSFESWQCICPLPDSSSLFSDGASIYPVHGAWSEGTLLIIRLLTAMELQHTRVMGSVWAWMHNPGRMWT